MKILITGASGLIGRELQKSFTEKGYEMMLATRSDPKKPNEIQWDTKEGFASEDLKRLEGLDAVVHLAGENISGFRWTDEKKRAIRDSRVLGTRCVVEALGKLENRPRTLISASGIIYGDRGDEILTEESSTGNTFLSELAKDWEAEAELAGELGIRVAMLRIGPVLAKEGGALAAMLTPFSLGLGGAAGSGKQWMSWIALSDLIAVINFVLEKETLRGAINTVSPNPVTNEEFTKTLGGVLSRPTILSLPEFAVRLMFGEMGEALLLSSARVVPKRLEDAGFEFVFPHLKPALEHALNPKDK